MMENLHRIKGMGKEDGKLACKYIHAMTLAWNMIGENSDQKPSLKLNHVGRRRTASIREMAQVQEIDC